MERFHYIVVGGGIAGVTCLEHLYILDPERPALLITASDVIKAVTNIQFVTKYLDYFDVEERPSLELKKQCPGITIEESAVTKLDGKEQIIYASSGKEFKYEKLCICTGAYPKIIDEGNPFVLWIRDTDSVKKFQSRLSEAKRIVVVGNGGIATELVYEIEDIEIIWAIKDKSMNHVFIDPGAAQFFQAEIENEKSDQDNRPVKRRKYTVEKAMQMGGESLGGALGPDWHASFTLKGTTERKVTLETEVEVKKIWRKAEVEDFSLLNLCITKEEDNWPIYVELTNGNVYGCDFIVSATGVTPNTSVFSQGNEDLKLGEDGGILVNDKMETSLENVYAAGDVCSAGWPLSQHWFQMRLWTQARQMGSYAAKCMWSSLTQEEIYMDFCFELFCHATKFFGYKVILLGLFNGQNLEGNYDVLLRVTKGKEYIKCVMVDGRMQGALLIGETDLEETFENLILNQMDLSIYGEELLDPNIDIEDYFD